MGLLCVLMHSVYSLLTPNIHIVHLPPMMQESVKKINVVYISRVASDKKFQVRYVCSDPHVQKIMQKNVFHIRIRSLEMQFCFTFGAYFNYLDEINFN